MGYYRSVFHMIVSGHIRYRMTAGYHFYYISPVYHNSFIIHLYIHNYMYVHIYTRIIFILHDVSSLTGYVCRPQGHDLDTITGQGGHGPTH